MTTERVKTKYKVKWKNLFYVSLIFILLGALIFGGIMVTKYFIDYRDVGKIVEKIHGEVEVKNTVDNDQIKTFKQSPKLSKFDIYWDYVKLGLIDVDMADLKKMNSDTIGYMEIKGSDFSYPIVKSDIDGYYKNHSFLKKENQLGWLYVDKEASLEELEVNNIVFGNKVYGKHLMGAVESMLNSDWSDDKNNFVIRYSTNYYSTLWQIVSVYHTKESAHLRKDFENEEEVQKFANDIISKSEIRFKASALASDKFLTITTNGDNSNTVIHAKLIKLREEQ